MGLCVSQEAHKDCALISTYRAVIAQDKCLLLDANVPGSVSYTIVKDNYTFLNANIMA